MKRRMEDMLLVFLCWAVPVLLVAGLAWGAVALSIMGCENSWSQPSEWHFTTECIVLVDGNWVPADTVKVVPLP